MAGLIPARKRGRPKRTEDDIAPTPETAAKLQRDQLSHLLKQGALTPDQEHAARRIHSFSLALKRGMTPQSRFQADTPGAARPQPLAPLERLDERRAEQWQTLYKPWAGAMGRHIVCARPKLTALGLVERIVNENECPDSLAAAFDLPRDHVIDALATAMDEYIAQKREKKSL